MNDDQATPTVESEPEARAPYEAPEVTHIGSFTELTAVTYVC